LRHECIPDTPLIASSFDKKPFYVSKIDAWQADYIQIDSKRTFNSIILDIDGGDPLGAISNVLPDLVRPNYMIGRWMTSYEWSGKRFVRPHIVFHLKSPVWKSNKKQMALFEAIKQCLLMRFEEQGCSVDNVQPIVTKNPYASSKYWDLETFSPAFATKMWRLGELAHRLNTHEFPISFFLEKKKARTRERKKFLYLKRGDHSGRNEELFNQLRFRGYYFSAVEKLKANSLRSVLMSEARELNERNFPLDLLSENELKHIVRSIQVYCDNNPVYFSKTVDQKERGAARDRIHARMNLSERQAIGGKYAAEKNANRTFEKLARFVVEQNGKAITKRLLAERTKTSLNTVKKYWPKLFPLR